MRSVIKEGKENKNVEKERRLIPKSKLEGDKESRGAAAWLSV